jgi:hypothetical protein
MEYRLIKVNEVWHVAFKNKGYGDFVIEFSQTFATKDEADDAARTRKIKPLNTADEK